MRHQARHSVSVADIEDTDWENPDDPASLRVATISSGKVWTDFLNSSGGMDPLVVSHRVYEAITRSDFTGVSFRELTLSYGKRTPHPPCKYYELIPQGRALNFNRQYLQKIETVGDNSPSLVLVDEMLDTHRHKLLFHEGYVRCVPQVESWDGSDVLKWNIIYDIGTNGTLVCTRRFLELAWNEKWTNVSALPVDNINVANLFPLTKCEWPPENWYPAIQTSEWRFVKP